MRSWSAAAGRDEEGPTAADEHSSDDVITLVRGATFWVTDRAGTVAGDTWQGLYHRDVRLLSHYEVTFDGRRLPLLASHRLGASSATQVHAVATDGRGNVTALLTRRRAVAGPAEEVFEVRAFAGPIRGELVVALGCDFATLEPVGHRIDRGPAQPLRVVDDATVRAERGSFALTVHAEPAARTLDQRLCWQVDAAPGRPWQGVLRLVPAFAGRPPASRPESAVPALRLRSAAVRWQASVTSALADLEALRVDAPDLELAYLGAGAPWFMALFGRDSLVAAHQSLITGPAPALDVLRSLGRHQGRRHDDRTLEQPGRILHELRTGGTEVFGLPAGQAYYGTVDASPLYVMLLEEAHRWGAAAADVRALLPHARAALRWCVEHGDLDGDGFVEYRSHVTGLANHGWKDSADAVVHADGSRAEPPLALVEVQAYIYGACLALARLEERLGDPDAAPALRDRAATVRVAFERAYWLADRELLAMGLDAGKRPLAVANSDMGHALWTGVLRDDVAAAVAQRLAGPDLRTRWGLRTLGAGEVAYNPLGYHVGSVWPHDTALAVAGLARYGHWDVAAPLLDGLLEACEAFGWRLPELYAGLDVPEVAFPVPYPVACSPQAWSAGVPLLLLRTVLGLAPDVPAGVVRLAPRLPDDVELTVSGIGLGVAGTLDLRVRGRSAAVLAAPAGLDVRTEPS